MATSFLQPPRVILRAVFSGWPQTSCSHPARFSRSGVVQGSFIGSIRLLRGFRAGFPQSFCGVSAGVSAGFPGVSARNSEIVQIYATTTKL